MSYDLYDGTPPHEDARTSKEAAEKVLPKINQMHARIFRFLRNQGAYGSIDDEGEVALEMKHQTYTARRRELVLMGFVVPNGKTRKTRSDCRAQVWVATTL